MLARLRRRFTRRTTPTPIEAHWALNHRVDFLFEQQDALVARVGEEMAAATAGYVGDFHRRADALESAIDAAVGRAVRQAYAVSREHTEAAVAALDEALTARSREHVDAAAAAAQRVATIDARQHAEALSENLRAELLEELAKMRRTVDLARRSAPTEAADHGASEWQPRPADDIDPAFYVALEDRFRGDQRVIAEQQRRYIPYIDAVVDDDHPLLDLGCGRGEWLRVLRDAGIAASGVDANPVAVAECLEDGLKVDEADLTTALASARDGSLGAISMLQVVEHLPFPLLLQVFRDCARALRPGGVLVIETPNALNLQVAATTFWLDPTHQRPLHPELLRLIAKESGFARSEGLFMNRLGEPTDLEGIEERTAAALTRLLEHLDGPGDFVMLAWTPR